MWIVTSIFYWHLGKQGPTQWIFKMRMFFKVKTLLWFSLFPIPSTGDLRYLWIKIFFFFFLNLIQVCLLLFFFFFLHLSTTYFPLCPCDMSLWSARNTKADATGMANWMHGLFLSEFYPQFGEIYFFFLFRNLIFNRFINSSSKRQVDKYLLDVLLKSIEHN